MPVRPLRIRDFVADAGGWLYAVATYDNDERAGCILRYVPDPSGDRTDPEGTRYRKVDFDEAFSLVRQHKPGYLDLVHRIPLQDIALVLKPEEQFDRVCSGHAGVNTLKEALALPSGMIGCTGSLLCGLGSGSSDIDLVIYGRSFDKARERLASAMDEGLVDPLSPELWRKVYDKRVPEISYDQFIVHEKRKWNRGQVYGTYFDLLFSRGYDQLPGDRVPSKGTVLGRKTVRGVVTDDRLSFDSPAVYPLEDGGVEAVYSFTHTYCGQAREGECIEACGVVEESGGHRYLIVGTTREARGEYIVSRTLLDTADGVGT
jgi:predicted nucleotidyltransferase